MPVAYSSTRINNAPREYAILRDVVDGEALVIFKDQLESFDVVLLDTIEDDEAGVDLYDKLETSAMIMANRQTAFAYFQPFFRKLTRAISDGAVDDIQFAKGAIENTLTVGVRGDRPHVFVSFKFFDSDAYDNEVAVTGTVDVLGKAVGGSGYFEIFGSPLSGNDLSAYAEQGSALESVRSVPSITGATHYMMTVIALGENN